MIVPRHGDAKLVEWASRSYLMEVIEAGVKVYLYEPGFNHSKILVSDDNLSSCGSTNIDFRSFENNFEANAFFFNEGMALRLKKVFLTDQAQSTLVDDVSYSILAASARVAATISIAVVVIYLNNEKLTLP